MHILLLGDFMEKKTVLITGSGSGLGKMAAIKLARRGHKVIATALHDEEVHQLNDFSKLNSLDIQSFKLDITLQEDRDKILLYDFDVLINNAAIGNSGSICEIPINNFIDVFNTNVFSNILITQNAFKVFSKLGKGRVIFISSLAGRSALPFLSPYCSSKFAIEGFTESLIMEMKILKNPKVDVCLIEPGAYATGFNKENNEKMYSWMGTNSYFKDILDKIHSYLEKFWNFIETKNYNSIINMYIKAVETKKLKKRYIAPLLQGITLKFITLFK